MTIEEAINKIDFGKCMLFTGAGFSKRAKWNIESDEAGFSRKEDVRKTLKEMLMITSANNKYLS